MISSSTSRGIRALLVAGTAAIPLAIGLAAPAAATVTPSFEGIALSEPGTLVPPGANVAKSKNLALRIDGPALLSGFPYRFYGADVAVITSVQRNPGIASITNPPTINAGGALDPAGQNVATVTIYQTTVPGKYRIVQPVTMTDSGLPAPVTRSDTRYLTIRANTVTSKKQSWVVGSGYIPGNRKVKVYAPDYQSGAKVIVYAKKRGQSTYHRASNTRALRPLAGSYSSKATLTLARAYDRRGTKFYVKVAPVAYAAGYTTRSYRVR